MNEAVDIDEALRNVSDETKDVSSSSVCTRAEILRQRPYVFRSVEAHRGHRYGCCATLGKRKGRATEENRTYDAFPMSASPANKSMFDRHTHVQLRHSRR